MRHYCLYILAAFVLPARAQQPAPRDTSFTNYSAYTKTKKTHPFISIVTAEPGGIKTAMNIPYAKSGGRELKLDVFYPDKKSNRPVPAVLMIHGGGWRSGDRSQHIPMAKMLASKGYVAILAEYRLSTEAIYPAAVIDLKTAARWIRANAQTYSIDKDKIAVWGYSAGGQLAALLASTSGSALFGGDHPQYAAFSDKFQALIDVDGLLAFIHPESGEGDDSRSTSSATYWFGAPKSAGTALWQQASALNHVSSKNPPSLFLNSSVARMHAGRDDMIKKLDSLHIYSEVHTFNDAPHTFPLFEPWFTPVLNYTVGFLERVFGK